MPDPDLSAWLNTILSDDASLLTIQNSENRIRNAYREYLSGYTIDPQGLIKIVAEGYSPDSWIEQKDIPFFSMCAHHFLPFFGVVNLRYSPTSKLIGIGKLPRLVECFSRRLTMQETIVREIGDFLMNSVEAMSVEVTSKARHLCVEARGPRAVGSTTSCSYKKVKTVSL